MDSILSGWMCPVCKNVMNPFISMCPHCMRESGGVSSTSTEITKEWEEFLKNVNIETKTS